MSIYCISHAVLANSRGRKAELIPFPATSPPSDFKHILQLTMPRIIGLTGGIASGKSSVSAIWSSCGAYIIDADTIAREVVQPGRPALFLIRRRFGPDIINPDGTLNRTALGNIIFSDPGSRAALNRRIHPFIILSMLSKLLSAVFLRWCSVIVLDTPLLYESKTLLPFCSKVVVVACEPEQQVERMVERDGETKKLTVQEAKIRLEAQMPLTEKARRADVVIDNSGTVDQLRGKATQVLSQLQPSPVGELFFRGLSFAFATKLVYKAFLTLLGKSEK